MTKTRGIEDLSDRIERLVAEHLAASRTAAAAAVQRAFGATVQAATRPPRVAKSTKNTKRRTPEELAELTERLHQAASADPGQSLDALAARVGALPRELERSVAVLKRTGRLRSAGQRNHTRYFPTASGTKVSA